MRILFTRFPLESQLGGAEIQTISLMEGLARHKHEVSFLGSCPTLRYLCQGRSIPTDKLLLGPPPVTKWAAVSFLWRQFSMRKKLRNAMDKLGNVQAIVMLSLTEKLLLTPYALKKKIPVFWVEHDRIGPWLSRNPWLPKLRALSTHVTTVVVSSLSEKKYIALGWDPAHIITIPNGIDLSRFGGVIRKHEGPLTVGSVARLSPEKGLDVLADALRNDPSINLIILGKGRSEKSLRRMLQTPRMQLRTDDNVARLFGDIDIFVLPSREHDPFGLVVAEAMSIGLPVIVTDACGIATYLKNGENAVIVPAGDAKALHDAIVSLENPELRAKIGEEGRTLVRLNFTLQKMIERYEFLML